ncbi:helix-turn-helix domain-containing protein [Kocuria carniphila]
MGKQSALTQEQRIYAVACFEEGRGERSVAREICVSRSAVKRLYHRWRVRGRGALVTKPTKQSYSFEIKLAVVTRFLCGEPKVDLAREFDLSSPKLIETWARNYRARGEDALKPRPRGRPRRLASTQDGEESELQQLRREVEYLRAENAYLGKLRALREQQRRTK